MKKLYINSEVGKLKTVLLHRPDLSIKRLTPSNCESLLFDGVLWAERAQEEHDIFAETLRSQGVKVLYLSELLTETLNCKEARNMVLENVITIRRHGRIFAPILRDYLQEKPSSTLAEILIGGLSCKEINLDFKGLLEKTMQDDDFVLPPLPNHLYTRDTSCWINDGVSLNPMALPARMRETIHLAAIYMYHPYFKSENFKWWYDMEQVGSGQASIEGGDILVIGNKSLMIGMGERTMPQAVETLALNLFEQKVIEKIIAVRLPEKRAFMHLDTLMTMVDKDAFCVYPGLDKITSAWTITPDGNGGISVEDKKDLFYAIEEALDLKKLRLIQTVNTRNIAEREQWDDGNNLLAVSPRVVIGYDRNTDINRILREQGITVLEIPGSELGRGRGGARCMSCPLLREEI